MLNGDNLTLPDAFPKGSSHFRCRSSSPIRRGVCPDTQTVGTHPNLNWTPKNVRDNAGGPPPISATANRGPSKLNNPTRATTDAIISIGSNTDAALDRFHLDDNLIPQLHKLMTTVRSSKWEAKLRTADWGLSYEQAVTLSNALQADIGIAKLTAQVRLILQGFWVSF